MSFSAGAIVGDLKLNTSEFTHGILNAQAIASVFPKIVVDFLENPLLGLIATAKEAGHALAEMIEGTAERFHNVGLAAERAGVDVEWLSGLAGVAQTAGVGLDQLVVGFKILEQQAALASEGDKAASAAFRRLGISAAEAAELMETPQALFQRVKGAIDEMGNASLRAAAAKGVLGRQGFNLVPLLTQEQTEIDAYIAKLRTLGGVVTKEQAEMGRSFGQLKALVGAAWLGIKTAVAEPILQYAKKHFEEIVKTLTTVAGQIRGALVTVGPAIVEAIPQIIRFATVTGTLLVSSLRAVAPLAGVLFTSFLDLGESVAGVLAPALDAIQPALNLLAKTLQLITDLVKPLIDWVGDLVNKFNEFAHVQGSGPLALYQSGKTPDAAMPDPRFGVAGGATIGQVNVTVPGVSAEDAAHEVADKVKRKVTDGLKTQLQSFNGKRASEWVEVSM